MRVTVLTPTLNAERFLPDCLASVQAQTLPRDRIEHLVLDGESRDGTAGLARAAGATVSVAKDSSLYEAMNRGVRLATGDVIGWLNADDVYTPDALEQVVRTFERTPASEVVVGDYELARSSGVERVRTRADALERLARGERSGAWVSPIGVFFRATTLRGIGEYRSGLRVAADLDLWMRAAARTPLPMVAHTGTLVGSFRFHDASLSSGADPEPSLRELIEVGSRWASADGRALGVARYGMYVRRKYEFERMRWRTRNDGRPQRLGEAVKTYLSHRALGPGAFEDVREQLLPFALELLRGGTARAI